jgi:hypothetical protein
MAGDTQTPGVYVCYLGSAAVAADAVLVLLTRLAARRHGTPAVPCALSRSERAPATIAAL